jgi:hypothetical protein
MPITSSKIRDARPAINAKAESEKKLFSADISKGTINVKRGEGRQPSFALKYEEVAELKALLTEVDEHLSKNQYGTSDSLKDGYEAGTARYTAPSRSAAEGVVTAADPTTSNETAQVEATTPAAQPATVEAQAELDSEDNPFGA